MNKIYLSLLAGVALLMSSCDMDTKQEGVLDDTAPLTFDYATQMRNYTVYSALRSASVGAWVYTTELQLDQFIGLSTNGGRGSNISNGVLSSSTPDFDSFYSACYVSISSCNYLLDKLDNVHGELTDDQKTEIERYKAEVKFTRAFFYFFLLDHYCNTNDAPTNAENSLGLQIVSKYDPTGDSSKYPARSSLKATIEFIQEDLTDAFDGLEAYEKAGKGHYENCSAGANYLSSYAVAALQARMSLSILDYAAAAEKAKYVIGNTNYQLATLTDYLDLWEDTNVDELIFAPYVDRGEISNQQAFSTCQGYNYWWGNQYQSDYVPTEESFDLLYEYQDEDGQANDVRFIAFLGGDWYPVNTESGLAETFVFWKYPGNPDLDKSTPMYDNTPKPFRLSEQYLILAEASAMINGGEGDAQQAITDLVKARLIDDADFTKVTLTGNDLLTFIKKERSKELMGEGFRLSDLRRWKQGFDRNQPYTLDPDVAQCRSINDLIVNYTNDDHRFVWAIPQSEININPQIKNQQNPGYGI